MFGLAYVKPVLIGVVSVALLSLGWYINGNRWSLKYEQLIQQQREALLQAEREARGKELVMQSLIDKERRDKDARITNLNNKLNAALNELRQRPTREANASNPRDHQGSTGASLFREDATFLTREAARADRAIMELKACYASYDAIRETINKE